MVKLRVLEKKAAILIQRRFRAYKEHVIGQPKSRGCQTDPRPAFERMSENFYSQLESPDDLMSKLKKSLFEAYSLFYIAKKMAMKKAHGQRS